MAEVVQITWLCREEMISSTESWCWETSVAEWWVQVCWKFLKTSLKLHGNNSIWESVISLFCHDFYAASWWSKKLLKVPTTLCMLSSHLCQLQSWNHDTTLNRCEGMGHYFSRMWPMSPNFMVAMDRIVVITERIPAFWPQHCSSDAIQLVLQGCKPGCARERCHLKVGWQLLTEARTIQWLGFQTLDKNDSGTARNRWIVKMIHAFSN